MWAVALVYHVLRGLMVGECLLCFLCARYCLWLF